MKESMLDSQLKTLEEPVDAIVVNADGTPASTVRTIRENLKLG
jgi:gluconate kinase